MEDYIPRQKIPPIRPRVSLIETKVVDEAQYDQLSLERASLKKEQDRIDSLANANKEVLRTKLKKLGYRFSRILSRNSKLLPSQIIPVEELELDERVTEYLDDKLEEQLALVRRKMAFDVQKSEVGLNKLMSHFIEPLSYYPFIVRGLNSDVFVKMLRQRKTDPRNEEMLKIVDDKILESEAKGR